MVPGKCVQSVRAFKSSHLISEGQVLQQCDQIDTKLTKQP